MYTPFACEGLFRWWGGGELSNWTFFCLFFCLDAKEPKNQGLISNCEKFHLIFKCSQTILFLFSTVLKAWGSHKVLNANRIPATVWAGSLFQWWNFLTHLKWGQNLLIMRSKQIAASSTGTSYAKLGKKTTSVEPCNTVLTLNQGEARNQSWCRLQDVTSAAGTYTQAGPLRQGRLG